MGLTALTNRPQLSKHKLFDNEARVDKGDGEESIEMHPKVRVPQYR